MQVKMIEIRDIATKIAAMAIKTEGEDDIEKAFFKSGGYGANNVILVRLNPISAEYDAYKWSTARTMRVAHEYIRSNFDILPNSAVVDVRVILQEAEEPAKSEIWGL